MTNRQVGAFHLTELFVTGYPDDVAAIFRHLDGVVTGLIRQAGLCRYTVVSERFAEIGRDEPVPEYTVQIVRGLDAVVTKVFFTRK